MNNKIYPEFIEDFKNYVAGIKNLSASYIDSMLSTLKGFLEFVNDQLQSERAYIHDLLCAIGFPEGLKTIAAIANEVLSEEDPQR